MIKFTNVNCLLQNDGKHNSQQLKLGMVSVIKSINCEREISQFVYLTCAFFPKV